MRAVRFLAGSLLGIALLCVALVLVVTLLVDPNHYKGRIEALAQQASGQPLRIQGDIDISWYPWLALRTGAAQFGGNPPLAEWQAARVGARLLPLLKGELIVDRVRFDGLRLRLARSAQGRSNWDELFSARRDAAAGGRTPEIGGIEIRDGALEFADAASGTRVALSEWRLDLGEWQAGKPFMLRSGFKLQQGAPSTPHIPVELDFPGIRLQTTPVAVAIPGFSARIGAGTVSGSLQLPGVDPLRAEGELRVTTTSLRRWLADLGIGGPRPSDEQALGTFKLTAHWAVRDGALVVEPIGMQLDETKFTGTVKRAAPADSAWSVQLHGDRIDLDRYVHLEDTDSEPFVLPTAALKALRVQGVLSYGEAQLAGARMKDARLRLEP